MYTQCPECGHTQTLSVDELRQNRGMVHCSHCSTLFDALQRLSEMPPTEAQPAPLPELPWTARTHRSSSPWGFVLLLGCAALTGQLLYFEGPAALKSKAIRPWLEKACVQLHCKLPSYRNLDEFAVLRSTLMPSDNSHYIFQALINNQAAFPQQPPDIRLTFMKLTGEPFAQSIFRPERYLPSPLSVIEVDQSFEISLNIAPVDTTIGGYTLELI